MLLNIIQNSLKDKQLAKFFPDIVSLVNKRISEGKICSAKISDNKFSVDHFLEIYTWRLKWAQQKQTIKKIDGLEKSVDILGQFEGFLNIGYLDTTEEHITFFYSEDLERIIALFKIDK